MKRKFTTLLMLAFTVVSVGFLASCKDYEEESINQLRLNNEKSLQDVYKALKDSCNALRGSIVVCKCDTNKTKALINNYFQELQNGSAQGQGISNYINTLIQQYAQGKNYDNAIDSLKKAGARADSIIGVHSDSIKNYAIAINRLTVGLNTALGLAQRDSIRIDGVTSRVDSAVYAINKLTGAFQRDSIAIVTLQSKVETLRDSMGIVDGKVKQVLDTLKNFATKKELADSISNLRSEVTKLVAEREKYIMDSVRIIDNKLESYNKALNKADSLLSARIDEVVKDLGALTKRVDALEKDVQQIKNDINDIKNELAKQVNGIVVQQVVNPVIGTFTTPLGVNTNILLAYYGETNSATQFPETGDGVNFDDVAKETIKKGILVENNENLFADAGKIFLTVNPSNVDFTGLKVALANSQNVASPVRLDTLAKSDATLKLGYTRATSNYLYETNARILKKDIENASLNNRLTVSKSEFASDIKAAIKNRTKSSLKEVATDIFNVAKDLRLDAEGVTVTSTNLDGTERAVTSEYGIAACAVKPLNFHSLDALENVDHIPGYSKAYTLLDKINSKLHSIVGRVYTRFNDESTIQDIQSLKIDTINFDNVKGQFVVTIDTTIYLSGLKYHLDFQQKVDVPVKFTQDVNVPIKFSKDIEVNLEKANITTPTVVVTTNIKNKNGTAVLVVPVKDGDKTVGNAVVNLDDIDVSADATLGDIKVGGTVVAHIDVDQTQTVTISVDKTVSTTVNIEKWIYFGDEPDEEGNLTKKAVHLWISKDFSDQIKSYITNALTDVNDMLNQVNKTVIDAQDLINDINDRKQKIDDKIDSYTDKVREYLDKINEKALKVVNKLPKLAQPVMLINSSNGFGVLGAETNESGSVTLMATTYSAGLVAPVCKKYVDINGTKVEVSNTLGKFDATSYLKPGKNVIRYAALDYAGNEVNRQYVIYYK